jgi:hypothetical protein
MKSVNRSKREILGHQVLGCVKMVCMEARDYAVYNAMVVIL